MIRVREITGVQPVDKYIKLSRCKWLGHVLRREGVIVWEKPGWQVQSRRMKGRPKETLMRTMRREAGQECLDDLEDFAQDIW